MNNISPPAASTAGFEFDGTSLAQVIGTCLSLLVKRLRTFFLLTVSPLKRIDFSPSRIVPRDVCRPRFAAGAYIPRHPADTEAGDVTTSPKSDQNAGRFDFLDVVRGLAALGVLLEHSCEICVPGFTYITSRYFHPVPFLLSLFMLVSGFIIPASLERTGSASRFWVRRFFRLYPLYWFDLILLYLLYLVTPSMTTFDPRSGWHWLANFTMFQDFLRVPHANPVVWTLTIEMAFYITCTVLFSFGLLRRSCSIAWAGVAVFGLAGTGLPLLLGIRFPAGYVFLFLSALFGMVFYRLQSGQASRRHLAALLSALLIVSAASGYFNLEYMHRLDDRFTFRSVFPAWVAAFVVFAVLSSRRRAMSRLLLGLGTISYSVYLLHPIVLRLMPAHLPAAQFLPLTVSITLAVASVTYALLERPFIQLGHTLTKRKPAPAELASAERMILHYDQPPTQTPPPPSLPRRSA
jgi:peptidoglycan/LPS O-acetylase OafA/YrhL